MVHLLQQGDLLRGDLAQDADGQSRAREGVPSEDIGIQIHLPADATHLVLEEQAQGLHHLQVHAFGQSTHVVVALDGDAWAVHAYALDHIGVDGALTQPLHVLDPVCLAVEHLDEGPADGLAFGLGLLQAFQGRIELVPRIHPGDVQAQMAVALQYPSIFVLPEQAVVHEDAMEPVADGAIQQEGGHGTIHPPAQGQHYLFFAELALQAGHGAFHEAMGGPIAFAATDADDEIVQQLKAIGAVVHLGMELHSVSGRSDELVGRHGHLGGAGDHLHGLAGRGDGVAMAHPDLGAGLDAIEQLVLDNSTEVGPAIFPHFTAFHRCSGPFGQQLGAITDG